MSFLVTDSNIPLQAETLPALKITEFRGEPARGQVYAYLRCYLYKGSVHYNISIFDENPPVTARVGFAITADDTAFRYFFISLSKAGEPELSLYERQADEDLPIETICAPTVHKFGGADEQGGYWGVEGVLPASLWSKYFKCTPRAGDILPANVFLYDKAETAFGAAFGAPEGAHIPTADGFSPFVVVPY